MKKMFKKAVTAVLAVALLATSVLGLASCGDNGDFEKDTFKIGATGPLTGDAASYGISVQNGAALAVKHLNEGNGNKFSFVIKDDKGEPEEASANYDVLADAGMQLSLSGVTSAAAEAFATKANADGIFAMTPSGSADNVINGKKYSFRLCFGDPDQGALAAQEIKTRGYNSVGVIYDTSDSYSAGIFEAFKTEMQSLGITYTTASFDAENKTDFSSQAEALKDCDVIFMPFYYTEASLFIKSAVAKGSDAVFFGCDGFDGIASYVEDVTNKIMYITPFDVNATDAATTAFVAAYEAEYGSKPDQFAADAYDVVMTLAAAMEQAGVTDTDISPAELGNILYDTITSSTFSYDGLTGNMVWSKDGKCTKEPNIVELN